MGYMNRDEAIKMVMKYDHVKPYKDLNRWLKYVDMTENEFDTHADTFRDKRVWVKENDKWIKRYNLWD